MSCTEVGTGLPDVVRVDSSSYWSKIEAMTMLAPLYTFSYNKKPQHGTTNCSIEGENKCSSMAGVGVG